MSQLPTKVPPVAFLGLVDRAETIIDGHQAYQRTNILGLKRYIASFIYPYSLGHMQYAVAVYAPANITGYVLRIIDESGKEATNFTLSLKQEPLDFTPKAEDLAIKRQDKGQLVSVPELDLQWFTFVVSPPVKGAGLIPKPGRYLFQFELDGEVVLSTPVEFILINAEPLTDARIAAIKSTPNATKSIRFEMQCNKCNSKIQTYASIEKSEELESSGHVWYKSLPDSFRCECGKVETSLEIIRNNLHFGLGSPFNSSDMHLVPMYERETLVNIRKKFNNILDEQCSEETIQKFIEENPIVFYGFDCSELYFKAPILTLHKTDFVAVTSSRELLLIEIERATTKLLKRDGGTHSELQHAIDQTRNWNDTARNHFQAVLECIGLNPKKVTKVSSIVIAGRDQHYDENHLRRLKTHASVRLLTYDDLLRSLSNLIESMQKI